MNRLSSDGIVREILLKYLQASNAVAWPGADGLTEDDILDHYPRAVARFEAPGLMELCRLYGELASEIKRLFESKNWLE